MNRSIVLHELGERYRRSTAGRTGHGTLPVSIGLEDLLRSAGCGDGDARENAEKELQQAESVGVLQRIPVHPRDPGLIGKIRLDPFRERAFFQYIGETSPSEHREALAAEFEAALLVNLPAPWRDRWNDYCHRLAGAARIGGAVDPFDRTAGGLNPEILGLLPRLLAWEGDSLFRLASCMLCGDSKRLEALKSRLESALHDLSGGSISSLEELGILPNPRSVQMHGPLQLRFAGKWMDFGCLKGGFRLSQVDIQRAEVLETSATRLLTVENETTFHELAKLGSPVLMVQTSFPGSGVMALLSRLPMTLECHHFGDSDAAGFEILRVLREKSGRHFQPLHMQEGRIPSEQESLGRPNLDDWPFYSTGPGVGGHPHDEEGTR